MSQKLTDLTLGEASLLLRKKEISSKELTKAFLDRIKNVDGKLNSYIEINEEYTLKLAEESDKRLVKGNDIRALEGCPVGLKDNFVTKELKTTCASKILSNFDSPYEGTPSGKLLNSGAVVLGKLNMDEFAMGGSGETSIKGECKNPYDVTRTPGGSSSGSAASVAAGLSLGALGTDTGGSIRQPAAYCGVVGLKPTYGRVSRYGVVAFASSLDQAGTLTKNVEDSAMMLQAIAGHDKLDSTSAPVKVDDYTKALSQDISGKTIGIVSECFTDGLSNDVKESIEKAIDKYKELGANIKQINLPHFDYAIACYYIVAPAEASSNLARYDGVRYGYRVDNPTGLKDLYTRSRTEGFGDEVKRRIMLGTYCLSSGYYDAYYKKAQQVRTLIRQDFLDAFNDVDVILTPTTPGVAFKLGERINDPLRMYLEDIYTVSVNLAGLPALSIPCGKSDDNMPIGMQLIGKPFDESGILAFGSSYEKATNWHEMKPEV